jgi:TonB family protein
MQRLPVLLAMAVAVTTLLAEEDPVVARVVDSIADRIPLQTVAPEYPRKARRDRIEGQVEVCFDIDRKGRPRRIAVRNSSNRAFEKPSIKAIRVSTFRPLNDDEELQSIKSCRTFIFSLEPAEVQADLIDSPRYAEDHHQRKQK